MPDPSTDRGGAGSSGDWTSELRARLAGLRLTPTREAEIVEELSEHLDLRYQELRAAGTPDDEARRLALDELLEPGTLAAHMRPLRQARVAAAARGESRPAGSIRRPADWLAELQRAARIHRRNLPTAAAVVATLALSIGVGTSIFSVVHALFLRTLPYGHADRLVMVWEDASARGGGTEDVSGANFLDWRDGNTSFAEMAAVRNITRTFTDEQVPYSPLVHAVTSNYFRLVGTEPLLGRSFAPGEDRAAAPVTMLSYGTWQRLYGGDPNIIGKAIGLDGVPHEIIGIVPPAFYSANYFPAQPGAWIPLPIETFREERGIRRFLVFGRLKDDIGVEQAQADMSAVARRLAARFPATNERWGARVVPIREQLVGRMERPLTMISLAVGSLMLIAALNVVCLLLASGTARVQEMAARRALGAPARYIVAQLFVETGMLAAAGAGLGLLISGPATEYLLSLFPQRGAIPFLDTVATSMPVALFAAACGVAIAMLCALATARQALRADVVSEMARRAGRSVTEGRIERRLRQGLVVAQVALSVTLLLSAALMARSLRNLTTYPLGFEAANTTAISAAVRGPKYQSPDDRVRFFRDLADRFDELPGVVSTSAVSLTPPVSMFYSAVFTIDGRDASLDTGSAAYVPVQPRYFETMKIPLIAGRGPTEFDTGQSEPVVTVSRELVRRYFRDGVAIGRTLRVDSGQATTKRLIVGVAGDVRSSSPDPRPLPIIYVPHAQAAMAEMSWVVRMEDGRPLPAAEIRRIVLSVDPRVPIMSTRSMEEIVTDVDGMARFVTLLLGVFTFVGLALVAAGIYGVLAFVVAMRQREIGVRLALGARFAQIARIVLGFAARVVTVGAVAGVVGFLALGRLFESLLFGVTRTDTVTVATGLAIIAAVTLLVCVSPLLRALRVSPLIVMKSE